MNRFKILFIVIIITVMCVSCGRAGNNGGENASSGSADGHEPYQESIHIMYDMDCQGAEGGVLLAGNPITFYDFASGIKYVLCSQPGCGHGDVSCSAYLGSKGRYAQYHDSFYSTSELENGGELSLRTRPADGGSWSEIWSCSSENEFVRLSFNTVIFGGGFAVIQYDKITHDLGKNTQVNERHIVSLELSKGNALEIDTGGNSYTLLGADGGFCLLSCGSQSENALDYDSFIKNMIAQGKSDTDAQNAYLQYEREHRITTLTVCSLSTGELTNIASGTADSLYPPTSHEMFYYGKAYYYQDGQVIGYDMASGTSSVIFEYPDVINIYGFDQKIFFISRTDDKTAEFLYYNMDNGKIVRLENDGNTSSTVFAVNAETRDYFIGLYAGLEGTCYISKEDFYEEKYENAKPL